MKLKIIVDNDLEEFYGKISFKTYEKMPEDKRPKLTDNDYFYLGDPNYRHIIIQINRNIVEDENIIYLHESGKKLFYSDSNFIEI